MKLRAIGVDAAFANMGFADVIIDTNDLSIEVMGLALATTEKEDKSMRVRVSSDRLRRGKELHDALCVACQGKAFAFCEVPGGNTQSATSAFSLGIAVGVLSACPIPVIEVSPMEVKAAIAGHKVRKGASKAEVIDWAAARWPNAPWMRAKNAGKSKGRVLEKGRLLADNEHLADALASVVAGLNTPAFKQAVVLARTSNRNLQWEPVPGGVGFDGGAVYLEHATPSPHLHRPTPRRVILD